jgi:hypothetical protein
MPTLTVNDMRAIQQIATNPQLTAAIENFRSRKNKQSELHTLGTSYAIIAESFESVRVIVQETRDVDYGDTSPEGLYQFIMNRYVKVDAILAEASAKLEFPKADEIDKDQNRTFRWYGASGSGA